MDNSSWLISFQDIWYFIQYWIIISFGFIVTLITLFLSIRLFFKFTKSSSSKRVKRVAFYHPYCNSRGGGERVLWAALRALQFNHTDGYEYYIYTGDTESMKSILQNVHKCFGISIQIPPKLIYLKWREVLEAKYYPFFTLLLQSLGSGLLGLECFIKLRPDILIDTTGHAFIYPIFSYLANCSVVSYTHYPTISTDMLTIISERYEAHNNRRIIAKSKLLSNIKLIYYRLFAHIYGHVGRYADVVMVNSSWTHDHILKIWKCPDKLNVVYPPCNTSAFDKLVKTNADKKSTKSIISIGQFRPEKNYPLQLRAFSLLLKSKRRHNVELVLIGGVRNTEDEERVSSLKLMAEELGISDSIRWCINASFSDLLTEVENGSIGLHTMWNEHFGISVVECMAGGLIMIAHDSGGPKADIVVKYNETETGYLANSEETYVNKIEQILKLDIQQLQNIRQSARNSILRFTEEQFSKKFIRSMHRAHLL